MTEELKMIIEAADALDAALEAATDKETGAAKNYISKSAFNRLVMAWKTTHEALRDITKDRVAYFEKIKEEMEADNFYAPYVPMIEDELGLLEEVLRHSNPAV